MRILHTENLKWKKFNIRLDKAIEKIKFIVGDIYLGASADSALHIHFSAVPSVELLNAIWVYWDSISETSEEAKYMSQQEIEAKIKLLREDAVTKKYDDLSVVQKKLLLGIKVTQDDLE